MFIIIMFLKLTMGQGLEQKKTRQFQNISNTQTNKNKIKRQEA